MTWRDVADEPPPNDPDLMVEFLMPSGRTAKMSGKAYYEFETYRYMFRTWRPLVESAAPCSVDD